MVNNTVYHFDGSNLGVEIFLKKREEKNGALKQMIGVPLYILYWGWEIMKKRILQNGGKFIQKLTPDFKNHMRNFRQAVECPESWNLMG